MESHVLNVNRPAYWLLLCCCFAFFCSHTTNANDFFQKGYIGIDSHYYPKSNNELQEYGNSSFVMQAELSHAWNNSFFMKLTPFARLDAEYDDRNSTQIKEFELEYLNGRNLFHIGQRLLSWSTVETVNVLPITVADVVNQRDIQGDPDGQEKLGRPMLSYTILGETTQLELHYMPFFVERLQPLIQSREHFAGGNFSIIEDGIYTDEDEETKASYAAKFEWVVGANNLALFHYSGYRNEPLYTPIDNENLQQLYFSTNTSGITLQSSISSWLIKLEAAYNDTEENNDYVLPHEYSSFIGGVEYTLIRPNKHADLGFFVEYVYDSRDSGPFRTPFEDDLFYGFRWASNNHDDATLLGGVLSDLDDHANIFHLNYKQRIGNDFGIDITARFYDIKDDTLMIVYENEHLLNLTFSYYL